MGDDGTLDLLDVRLVLDLNVEVARHHTVGGIGALDVDLLADPEPCVANAIRLDRHRGDRHVPRVVTPLEEHLSQLVLYPFTEGVGAV